ncbi:unnamed protein product [Darwinula stevensoni]|uniref:BEN domain-containing protein n=1 Tax=Darwinula stevensoni TaxID=69355 RepID=A0A7R9AFB1_9CRUS|nr:unnamed protein product [Darwinula stevensoni]CAG0903151.1 unnamed protein product [Darwinula stevensoni]
MQMTEKISRITAPELSGFTKDLAVIVFGREVLGTHCLSGKASNAHKGKERKPQLCPEKVKKIVEFMETRFQGQAEIMQKVHQALRQKCNDDAKYSVPIWTTLYLSALATTLAVTCPPLAAILFVIFQILFSGESQQLIRSKVQEKTKDHLKSALHHINLYDYL